MVDQAKALNGRGPAAKRARKLWWRRQFLAQGVYAGPLRLLGYLIAIGVPLAAYTAITQGVLGVWPYFVAVAAPLLVLLLSYCRHRLRAESDQHGHWRER